MACRQVIPACADRGRSASRPWSRREEELLGTTTDPEIARRLRRSIVAVYARRRSLDIPAIPIRRPWTKREIKLLGTMPDSNLAARLEGVSERYSISARPAMFPQPRIAAVSGPAGKKNFLGTTSDREVARKLKRTEKSVRSHRVGLGIRSGNSDYRPWTRHELRLVGKKPDLEVVALVGRSPSAVIGVRIRLGLPAVHNQVAGKPWSQMEVRLLGTVPDHELARQLGRSPSAVVCARLRFGRPAPPGQKASWQTLAATGTQAVRN